MFIEIFLEILLHVIMLFFYNVSGGETGSVLHRMTTVKKQASYSNTCYALVLENFGCTPMNRTFLI